jgi:6-phosphogluconolactonase (cycloisomerase 2 family)
MRTGLAWMMLWVGAVAASGCGSGEGLHPQPAPTPAPTSLAAKYAFVLSQGDGVINQYRIGEDGALSPHPIPTVAVGGYPTSMVMDTTRSYIYVSNAGDETISQFRIGEDGGLEALTSSPLASDSMGSLVVSPNGAFLYGLGWRTDSISRYSIGSDGRLTLEASYSSPDSPLSMAFSPSGEFAYVVNLQNDTISQYAVGMDGGLTPLTPATVTAAGCPTGPIATTRASGGGSYVYTLSCSQNLIDVFKVGADGTLSVLGTSVPTGLSPQGMAISGSSLYVANASDSTVSMFSIGADGSLSAFAQPTVGAGVSPETLALDAIGGADLIVQYRAFGVIQDKRGAGGTLVASGAKSVSTGSIPMSVVLK